MPVLFSSRLQDSGKGDWLSTNKTTWACLSLQQPSLYSYEEVWQRQWGWLSYTTCPVLITNDRNVILLCRSMLIRLITAPGCRETIFCSGVAELRLLLKICQWSKFLHRASVKSLTPIVVSGLYYRTYEGTVSKSTAVHFSYSINRDL